MSTTRVPAVVARPVRTGAQLATSYVLVEAVDSFIADLTERQYGALVALIALVLGWVQILVENYFGKAFLRHIPEHRAEVVDTAGGAR